MSGQAGRTLPIAFGWWIALAAVVLFAACIRWPTLDAPIERDEGEYAYAGQLILQGQSPYEKLYNMKLPGIYAAYAVVLAIFGETARGIHMGLVVLNAITIALVFLLGRRLLDAFTGVVAAATFAVLSFGETVQGLFANAEHFVLPAACTGLLLLLRYTQGGTLWNLGASGLFLGLGFLVKQHGIAFVLFAGVYLLLHEFARRPLDLERVGKRVVLLVSGVLAPYLVTCLIFLAIGTFDDFWYWTFHYARAYAQQVSYEQALYQLRTNGRMILAVAPLAWAGVAVGLSALLWEPQARRCWKFLLPFAVFSFLATCPGLFFRPHYFLLTLPAAALCAGLGVQGLVQLAGRARAVVGALIGLVMLGQSVYTQREYLFGLSPMLLSRATFGLNPFPEAREAGEFIRSRAHADDSIAVIGSEPEILFYTRLRSATPFVYTYPLMGDEEFALDMQRQMIDEIEESRPRFLVLVQVSFSWLRKPTSHPLIFEWSEKYAREHYDLTAAVDIFPRGPRFYRKEQLQQRQPSRAGSLLIFERNP